MHRARDSMGRLLAFEAEAVGWEVRLGVGTKQERAVPGLEELDEGGGGGCVALARAPLAAAHAGGQA